MAVGIETGRGPWVAALVAAGYVVYPVNPLQASRYREAARRIRGQERWRRLAHAGDIVRTDSHQLRPAAGDTPEAEAIKVAARAHKTLIWDRTRAVSGCGTSCASTSRRRWRRSRTWTPPTCWSCWAGAGPGPGGELTRAQVAAALSAPAAGTSPDRRDPGRAARRAPRPAGRADRRLRCHRPVPDRGDRHPQRPGQGPGRAGEEPFPAPDAEIYRSQPGMGAVPAPGAQRIRRRPRRYVAGKARRTTPHQPDRRASGKKKVVTVRFIHNDRLSTP